LKCRIECPVAEIGEETEDDTIQYGDPDIGMNPKLVHVSEEV